MALFILIQINNDVLEPILECYDSLGFYAADTTISPQSTVPPSTRRPIGAQDIVQVCFPPIRPSVCWSFENVFFRCYSNQKKIIGYRNDRHGSKFERDKREDRLGYRQRGSRRDGRQPLGFTNRYVGPNLHIVVVFFTLALFGKMYYMLKKQVPPGYSRCVPVRG